MMKPRVINLLLLTLLPFAGLAQERAAPELRLKDLRGHSISPSDYKGRVVLINFWATWCAPCLAEMPDLINLWSRLMVFEK